MQFDKTVNFEKLFDQILWQLVYLVPKLAGMPSGGLSAYRRFLAELVTYNIIAGVLGHGPRRECGLAQGARSP